MQFTTLLLLFPLATLVLGDACVAGGPTDQVTAAKACCFSQGGTWYQFYANQAICVLTAGAHTTWYNKCVADIPHSLLDTTCIPGDGGLSPSAGVTALPTWVTLTVPAVAAATSTA